MSQTREEFHEIRATGIGGSEVAAICGLDPNRDQFSVYAEKLGLVKRQKPNGRMRWGRLLEQAIVNGYTEETGWATEWCDITHRNRDRPWQLCTPDAYVWTRDKVSGEPEGGVDAKNVDFGRVHLWGERGTDDVPITIGLQLQWYCSGENLPWWDASALFGGNDLRIYRVHRDREIEAVILEETEKFWRHHVVARVAPPIGFTQTASEYLKQRFPKNTEPLRVATEAEHALLRQLKQIDEEVKEKTRDQTAIENAVKLAIGNSEGVLDGLSKVTYRKCKDTLVTDWEAAARDLIREVAERSVPADRVPDMIAQIRREQIGKHCVVAKEGSRRLVKVWK